MVEKWIQKANVQEGKFEAWCKDEGFDGVCQSCIVKAVKHGGEPARMALFAVNVSRGKYKYPKTENKQTNHEQNFQNNIDTFLNKR